MENVFEKRFEDQLILYLKRNKIQVSGEKTSEILEIKSQSNKEEKFQYFFTESNELSFLGAIQEILILKDGIRHIN